MTAIALFFSTMALIMALGAQSLLVNNGRYVAAACNSFVIGSGQLLLLKIGPDAAGLEILAYLTGGPIGIVLIMVLLRRYHRRPAP